MSTHPTFDSLADATGLDVIDPIETRHFSLFTSAPVEPTPADPESFAFPVANACRIRTDGFRLPYMVPMEVRTPDGDHLASIDLPTTDEFPADDYLLELHSPIKIYVRVTGALAIDATEDSVDVEFDRETAVEVGARSYHSEPAATVTVPDDPEALMEAVSAFSSALKTTCAMAHYVLANAYDSDRVQALVPNADAVIELRTVDPDEYGHDAQQRWHVPRRDITTQWTPL